MKTIELGKIGKFQSGGTPSRKVSSYFGGNIPWITTVALNGEIIDENDATDWLTEYGVSNSATKILPPFSLMIGTRVGVGKVAVNKVEMCTNQDIISIIDIDAEKWDLDYLRYFVKSIAPKLNEQARGATIQGIKLEVLQKTRIPLQEHSIQKNIASILQKVKKVIDNRKYQLLDLDNLIKSRFVEMFGDPKTNPMGWQEGTVRDIVSEVKYGTSRPAVEGGKYKYIRMNNITYNGEIDLSDLKYIDIPDKEIEKCIVRKGDVLFNRTNSKELVGKTCVFNQEEPMVIAGYIIRVRMNDKAIPEYLSAVLNSKYGKETLFGMCKAIVGQANINAQELQEIKIVIPPIELQNDFANFKEQVDKLKFDVQKALNEKQTLFDSLMQKYFG